jgi:hypothetical protein
MAWKAASCKCFSSDPDDGSVGTYSIVELDHTATGHDGVQTKISKAFANEDGVGIGYENRVLFSSSVAMGEQNVAIGEKSVALGYKNYATYKGSVAIGRYNAATCGSCIAIGEGAWAQDVDNHYFVYNNDGDDEHSAMSGDATDEVDGSPHHVGDRRLESEETVSSPSSPAVVAIGGVLVAQGANIDTVRASSDERIKVGIVSANTTRLLDNIKRLEVKHYDYTDNYKKHTNRLDGGNYGFIAQQVEGVMENAVLTTSTKDLVYFDPSLKKHVHLETLENFKSLNKDIIFTQAVGAIQELSHIILDLQERISVLESN